MTGAKPDEMIRTPMQWSEEKSEVELSLTEGPLAGNYQAGMFGTLISFLQGS